LHIISRRQNPTDGHAPRLGSMNIWTALTACCLVLGAATFAAASPTREDVPMPRPKPMLEAALAPVPATPSIVATGMPVPRWVTVKAERVNVRRGPSLAQDVLWTYVKTGTPVEVIAEYDAWRRIRDVDGSTGWVKGAMLDGRRNVVVTGRVNTAIL